jgi:cysteine desulfurase / selenocysteine lyase
MATTSLSPFDVLALRREFPILHQQVNGHTLAYLDSTASSQKPRRVIEVMDEYYRRTNANVHRGIYKLSEEATFAYERARGKIAQFIGAKSHKEIIFTRNATESINLVAYSWGVANLREGDRILATQMEHHANIVPWQMLAARTGAQVDYLPIDGEGRLALDALDTLLSERTKLVAFAHMSNVLGTINPAQELIARAKAVGALTLVDAAQSVPHMPVDVGALGCDFLAFSSHKMCGPTGIGVLWGRRALLEAMPPFMGGGDMIRTVSFQGSTWNELPWKFEAGTPAIAEAIGLGEAVDFLAEVGMERVAAYEHDLTSYALGQLGEIDGLTIHGPQTPELRGGAISFSLEGIHPHDVAAVLDGEGIAVRAGHHCAQPLHDLLGVAATTRASVYLYTTPEELDRLAVAIQKAQKVFVP